MIRVWGVQAALGSHQLYSWRSSSSSRCFNSIALQVLMLCRALLLCCRCLRCVISLSCSAQKQQVSMQVTAGLAAAAATQMLMPLAAAAEVTPSLK